MLPKIFTVIKGKSKHFFLSQVWKEFLIFTNQHTHSAFPVLQSRCSKRKVHLNVIEWEAANDRRKQEIQNELDKSYRIAQRAAAVVVLDLTTK